MGKFTAGVIVGGFIVGAICIYAPYIPVGVRMYLNQYTAYRQVEERVKKEGGNLLESILTSKRELESER